MKRNPVTRRLVALLSSLIRMGSSLVARRQSFVLVLIGVIACIEPLVSLSQVRKAPPTTSAIRAGRTPQRSEPSILSSGQAASSSGVAQPREVKGPVYSDIPLQGHDKEEEPEVDEAPVPQGRVWDAIPAPTDRPTESPNSVTPHAPNDMRYQLVHDISATEVATSERSTVQEPSVGNMGNTIFFSANWYAARSSDEGNTFTYVSPSTTFPSINGGFCCDQIVNYARNQDMMLWALQYDRDATSGTLRIARAVGSAAVASNTWVIYDFNPQSFGFASNIWMDFPNLTISSNFLYCSSNVFDTVAGCPSACTFRGSVVWRISLTELAAGGFINFSYLTRTDVGSPRCTEGATTTMYWAAFQDTSTLRIHRWDDSGGMVFWDNIALNPFTFLRQDGVATSPDGTNWAARASTRVLGATVTGGELAFMWPAKQDGSFPYPYTVVGRFSQATRALLSQQQVWNSGFAWLYMNASVNAVGHQAGMIAYGGGTLYPNSAIWINDDVQSGFAPLNNYLAAESNDGPNRNVWGDYLTVRPHKDFINSWVGTTYYMTTGGENENTIGRYIWFGRERDLPQPCGPSTINLGQTLGGSLSVLDCRSPARGNQYYADQYTFFGTAGQQVAIALTSSAFDTYLYLRGTTGAVIAEDDDGLGGTDSRIPTGSGFFTLPTTGTYAVEITSFFQLKTGAYTVSLILSTGSGTDTAGLYNPASSTFFLRNSNSSAPADLVFSYGPAGAGWIPVVGDWNGDGVDTIGLYNPSNSFFFLRNSNSSAPADLVFSYGPAGAGWIPIAGDWNGDGTDTIGLYNPATSAFFLRNSNTSGPADLVFGYGPAGAGWMPIAGDWNGDGVDTIGLYNPATSTFFLSNSNSSAPAALVFTYGPAGAGWKPLARDWNGDGTDTIGLYNPASSTFFLRNTNSSAPADLVFSYGPAGAGWIPIVGDWDGL